MENKLCKKCVGSYYGLTVQENDGSIMKLFLIVKIANHVTMHEKHW